jgi:hypothetical protein
MDLRSEPAALLPPAERMLAVSPANVPSATATRRPGAS